MAMSRQCSEQAQTQTIREFKFRVYHTIDKIISYYTIEDFVRLGKEIYEGDIVTYYDYSKKQKPVIVEYQNGEFVPLSFANDCCTGIDSGGNFEVIGNIHENPELLNNDE